MESVENYAGIASKAVSCWWSFGKQSSSGSSSPLKPRSMQEAAGALCAKTSFALKDVHLLVRWLGCRHVMFLHTYIYIHMHTWTYRYACTQMHVHIHLCHVHIYMRTESLRVLLAKCQETR